MAEPSIDTVTATTTRVVGAIVFTDLVGFTEFTDARGDVAALGVLERQLDIVRDALARSPGGRLVKEIGDGLMLWFASASTAVEAARTIRDRVSAARSAEFPLAIRVGVHAGEAIGRGNDLIGHCVNVASRIADTAGPNEIVVSDETLAAAGTIAATAQPIGAVFVKGVSDPVWLSRL